MTITPTEHHHLHNTAHDITTENHHTITQNPHQTIPAIQRIITDRTTQKLHTTPTPPTPTKP